MHRFLKSEQLQIRNYWNVLRFKILLSDPKEIPGVLREKKQHLLHFSFASKNNNFDDLEIFLVPKPRKSPSA